MQNSKITMKELLYKMVCYQELYPNVHLFEKTDLNQMNFNFLSSTIEAFRLKKDCTKLEYCKDKLYHVISKYYVVDQKEYVMEIICCLDEQLELSRQENSNLILKYLGKHDDFYLDVLTGAYNRRFYEEKIKHQTTPAGIVMLDVDDFKIYNDTFGHDFGDRVLKMIVEHIKNSLRNQDKLIRYGGDEFIIYLPNIEKEDLYLIMQNILKIENLKKYYGTKNNITKAIDNISFSVNKGEFVAIMGASGSGKTTLLNCISTIDTVTAGKIIINGNDITEIKDRDIASFRRNNLGFVFQDFNLLDTLTIAENISLSLIINKKNENKIDEMVNDIAKRLGIEGILDKFPYEVSGGQKQRCACARALINNPKLILADEPTGALDSKSSRMLLETMDEINKKLNATILMVTHDAFSASFCQRILFLKDGNIFTEILKGSKTRKEFFNEILDILTLLGGDVQDVK